MGATGSRLWGGGSGGDLSPHTRAIVIDALAHAVGHKVEAAYRRGDLFQKRRRLMDVWGDYCSKIAPAGTMIVSLREAAPDA
jgi:hypothetical protein